jgi:hypothetical protein
MHGRTRARNRHVERPTHATVWALGVVCANAGSPSQCHGWYADWRGPLPPATAVWEPRGPHADWEASSSRSGGRLRCEGEARGPTWQCTSIVPRRWQAL